MKIKNSEEFKEKLFKNDLNQEDKLELLNYYVQVYTEPKMLGNKTMTQTGMIFKEGALLKDFTLTAKSNRSKMMLSQSIEKMRGIFEMEDNSNNFNWHGTINFNS